MEHIVNGDDSKETPIFSMSEPSTVTKNECASREEAKDGGGLKQCPTTEPRKILGRGVSSSGETIAKAAKEFAISKSMKLKNPSASGEKVTEVKQSEIQKSTARKLNADAAAGSGKKPKGKKKELAIPGPSKLVADSSGSGQMPKVAAKQLALSPAPDMKMGNSRGKKGSFENMDPKFCVQKPPWAEINALEEKNRDYTALSKKGIGKDCVALKHCPAPKQRKRLQRAIMKFQEWLKSR